MTEKASQAPPFLPGLPLLGNALDFARDPVALFQRGYERLGPVFGVHLARKPAVVLIGPEHNRFVLENTDTIFSMREGYQFLKPMFGERIFFAASREEYRNQRAMMLPAFQGRRMAGYVEVMGRETQRWLDELGEEGVFDLVTSLERLTMYIAASALLGEDFRMRLGDHFAALYRDLALGIEFLLPTNLPLPRFIRRDRAKRKLEALIDGLIAERRADPEPHNDFLDVFLGSTYRDGSPAPEEVIRSLVMGLVFAGHETTAGHASWALVQLLEHPDYLAQVMDELQAKLGEKPAPVREDLPGLEHLAWALKETERTRPVAQLLIRTVQQPFDLNGFHIPAGWAVFISPAVSHRLPQVFDQPERWDPLRFAPGREEDRRTPFALVGFGGGPHKCLGMNFAYNEMLVIFSMLLRQFELELLDPHPKAARSGSTSRPERPCRVRYRRRR